MVDDDKLVIELLQKLLKADGFETVATNDSSKAIELAKQEKPDLLLLDLMMPEMTGDVMLDKLRKTTWGKSIKVVILTNMGEQEIPESVKKLGVSAVILKADMTPRQVAELVKKQLGN